MQVDAPDKADGAGRARRLVHGWSANLVQVVLGFGATPTIDSAMLVMTLGMLLTLPANLASGLYRVRGQYGRTVWLQNAALMLGQIAQIAALAVFGSLLAVAIAFVSTQLLF